MMLLMLFLSDSICMDSCKSWQTIFAWIIVNMMMLMLIWSDNICKSSVPRLHGPQKRGEWQEGDSQRPVTTFLKGNCPEWPNKIVTTGCSNISQAQNKICWRRWPRPLFLGLAQHHFCNWIMEYLNKYFRDRGHLESNLLHILMTSVHTSLDV